MLHSLRTRPALLGAAVLLVGVAGSFALARDAEDADPEGAEPPPVANTPVAAICIRAGLDADAICATGATSTAAADAVSAVESWLSQNPGALEAADAAYADARSEEGRLRRLVRSGKATAQEVADYQTAEATLATEKADRAAVIDAIFAAGAAELTAGQSAVLATIRANRHWRLDVKRPNTRDQIAYYATDRTQEEWGRASRRADQQAPSGQARRATGRGVRVDAGCLPGEV